MTRENLEDILSLLSKGNDKGEKISLVGATKTISVDVINDYVKRGLTIVAENRVQEFREKTDLIDKSARQDFIGHLQTNKVKYLVGKVNTIHSVDSFHLAEAISDRAVKVNCNQNILMEINVGGELSKSGFSPDNAVDCALELAKYKNINLIGIMAMLPKSQDEEYLASLCVKVRDIYETLIKKGLNLTVLSMGMSNDYKIAIKNGSNMVRLGSKIFGERNYGEE